MATTRIVRLRRCHVCGTVIETRPATPAVTASKGTSQQCSCCGKHLAPFYFFEESELAGVEDNQLSMSLWKAHVGYGPLWGLSALWSEDDA